MFFRFVVAIICTEAIVEIITKSSLFDPLRASIFRLGRDNRFFSWLHELIDCGYCFSVWVGLTMALLLLNDLNVVHWGIDWVLIGIVLHRMSNILHNTIDRIHG